MEERRDILRWLAEHPVAANLVMALMMFSGMVAVGQLNTQFFPTFELDIVSVRVEWRGATAEDVAESLTTPIEDAVRDVDGLREMTSTSADGVSSISLEFAEGTGITEALEDVKDRISGVRNLPPDAEQPTITRVTRYDPIARVVLSGDVPAATLHAWARAFEDDLLQRGVANVEIAGLAEQEMAVEVTLDRLLDQGITLQQLGGAIAAESLNLPAGDAGDDDIARQLRSLQQRRALAEFEDLEVGVGGGRAVRLAEIAEVEQRGRDGSVSLRFGASPAVELLLQRAEQEDALEAARILDEWLDEVKPTLPEGIELNVYDAFWELIAERIMLLVTNGLGGLLLVIGILLLFLTSRVAFWVTLGIPASFLAALTVLWFMGGSINMMSLFALIMTLGIIVDDAIVVGERGYARYREGEAPGAAAAGGAREMLAPVLASSLTTVAAFIPLMAVGGVIGNVLFDIPLVVICVIIASLVEAFIVLPGHLRRSFEHSHRNPKPSPLRDRISGAFDRFRDGPYRRAVTAAVGARWVTVAAAVGLLIASVGLLAGGRLDFNFFPEPEGTMIYANVGFAAGTPKERVDQMLRQMEAALDETEAVLGGGLVHARVARIGETHAADPRDISRGDYFGSLTVELVSPEEREVRNADLIAEWRSRIREAPGLERLVIRERGAGPPGADVHVRITGVEDPEVLRRAADEVRTALRRYSGVFAIDDDLPYGMEQWVYRLTPEGRALGLTTDEVGQQLRDAFAGRIAQIFYQRRDEVEVRLRLPEEARRHLASVSDFQVRLPGGGFVPLENVVELEARRGFEALRHYNGQLAVSVTADVDARIANAGRVRSNLEAEVLPEIRSRYGVQTAFGGRAEDQAETMADMRRGLILALVLIYLTLAAVFASYGWPLLVMSIIPFGLVGAFFGHWVMGLNLTILSLFGLFGLTGITVNNAIILAIFYKQIRARGVAVAEALIEASCQRLRPVILTSLTTIGGLLPLLTETSVQAQFLIPMAAAIAFGLAGTTLIVLFLMPALLSIYESAAARITGGGAPVHG